MQIPVTIYIALGAVAAALVAGFFSFLNLVSSKENKVSEFRQAWIDGIRQEIATYCAAMQAVVRYRSAQGDYKDDKSYICDSEASYRDVSESLAKIQLRLNPGHAKDNPNSHESKLLCVIHSARDLVNAGEFEKAIDQADEIRNVAAPFLKDEWERVKNGEERYKSIRDNAQKTITSGIALLIILAIGAIVVGILKPAG